MEKNLSCLIPTYNEGKRIFTVLDALLKLKNLEEIIVIDDASVIDLSLEIKKRYPEVKVLRFEKNHGKSGAVFEGLKIAKGKNILLFDADLYDINLNQLQEAIDYFLNHREVDMVILRRTNDPLFYKIIRTDTVTSGQRLLRTKDLKEIAKTHLLNFQLELAINDYMLKNKKNVGWLPLSLRDIFKVQKFGLIKGTLGEIKMLIDLLSYKGPFYFLKMLFSFCRKKLLAKT